MQPHYTSSSGPEPSTNERSNEPSHSNSRIGLPQEHTGSCGAHQAASGSNALNSVVDHAAGASQLVENIQSFDNAPSVSYDNTNNPVFDFGSPERSDFIQANNVLDPGAPLPQMDGMDPYIGFDIPFWLGQDQYWDMLHDRN
mgnify:CR=1 FL=1